MRAKGKTRRLMSWGLCAAALTATPAARATAATPEERHRPGERPAWTPTATGTDARFRGLAAVSRRTAWAAGSGGTGAALRRPRADLDRDRIEAPGRRPGARRLRPGLPRPPARHRRRRRLPDRPAVAERRGGDGRRGPQPATVHNSPPIRRPPTARASPGCRTAGRARCRSARPARTSGPRHAAGIPAPWRSLRRSHTGRPREVLAPRPPACPERTRRRGSAQGTCGPRGRPCGSGDVRVQL